MARSPAELLADRHVRCRRNPSGRLRILYASAGDDAARRALVRFRDLVRFPPSTSPQSKEKNPQLTSGSQPSTGYSPT